MKTIKFDKILYISAFLSAAPFTCFCSSEEYTEDKKEYVIYAPGGQAINCTKQEYKELRQKQKEWSSYVFSTEYAQEVYDQKIKIVQDYFSQANNFNYADDFTEEQVNTFYKSPRPTREFTKLNTHGYWDIVLGKYVTKEIIGPKIDLVKYNISYQIAPEAAPHLIYNLIRFFDWQDHLKEYSALEKMSTLIDQPTVTSKVFFEMLDKCAEKNFKDYGEIIAEYISKYEEKVTSRPKKFSIFGQ